MPTFPDGPSRRGRSSSAARIRPTPVIPPARCAATHVTRVRPCARQASDMHRGFAAAVPLRVRRHVRGHYPTFIVTQAVQRPGVCPRQSLHSDMAPAEPLGLAIGLTCSAHQKVPDTSFALCSGSCARSTLWMPPPCSPVPDKAAGPYTPRSYRAVTQHELWHHYVPEPGNWYGRFFPGWNAVLSAAQNP